MPLPLADLLLLTPDNANEETTNADLRTMLESIMPTGRTATKVVAANDATALEKVNADYVCDGVADEVQINQAIAALPIRGGTVVLTEGTFTLAAAVTVTDKNTMIAGQGIGTLLKTTAAIDMLVWNAGTISLVGCGIRDLSFDGQNVATSGMKFIKSGAFEFTQFLSLNVNYVGAVKNVNIVSPGRFISIGGSYEYGPAGNVGIFVDSQGADLILISPWFEQVQYGLDLNGLCHVRMYGEIMAASVTTPIRRAGAFGYLPSVRRDKLEDIYNQGNVSGTVTFDQVNGSVIRATLTGNITTLTLPGSTGINSGDRLTLILVQDATGSRTISWPSNFKKAGGALVLGTSPNSTTTVSMIWDGTNWVETARSVNNS